MIDYDYYINRLSFHNLKKKHGVYAFRCPFCGGSKSNPNKRQAYFLSVRDNPRFYCHKCGVSKSFYYFLKEKDSYLWEEYKKELFEAKKGEFLSTNKKKKNSGKIFVKKQEKIEKLPPAYEILKHYLRPLEDMRKSDVYEYVKEKRKIPERHYKHMFYFNGNPYHLFNKIFETDKYKKKANIAKTYKGILIPFINEDGGLVGFGMRIINSDYLRYLNFVGGDETKDFFLGEDRVDWRKPVYIVEGMLDKFTFEKDEQVLAMLSTNKKINYILEKVEDRKKVTYIYDNEYDNENIVKNVKYLFEKGFGVFLWGNDVYGVKDINDLRSNYLWTDKEMFSYLKKNVYSGGVAKMVLNDRVRQYSQKKLLGVV